MKTILVGFILGLSFYSPNSCRRPKRMLFYGRINSRSLTFWKVMCATLDS